MVEPGWIWATSKVGRYENPARVTIRHSHTDWVSGDTQPTCILTVNKKEGGEGVNACYKHEYHSKQTACFVTIGKQNT